MTRSALWLLLADAGTPVGAFGNPPHAWCAALPLYAELQRGEVAYAQEHLAHGVPDLRLATLPAPFDELLQLDLPLEQEETRRLRDFAPRFAELCDELAAYHVPETIQHDDLHHANLYAYDGCVRVLDGATRRSPIRSRRSSSRSGSSKSARSWRPATRGSRGCATRTSSRGVDTSATPALSPSGSAVRARDRVHATAGRSPAGGTRRLRHRLLDRVAARTRPDARLAPPALTQHQLTGRVEGSLQRTTVAWTRRAW